MAQGRKKGLNFISIFSGIEAASVAWEPLGWKAIAYSETEKFPSAVLKHRFPKVPNLGDMTKMDWSQYRGKADLVCGGPPCQDFSIAGKRASLGGIRGQLTLSYVEAIHAIRPVWSLTENVPGWLNTEDNAFGCFLAGLVGADAPLVSRCEGGAWPSAGIADGPIYGVAWRVLNAEYFGVPQRRRRVWVVGHLGDWHRAAQVLLEPKSLCWDPSASEKKRQRVAPTISARTKGSGGLGTDFDLNGGLIARPLKAKGNDSHDTYVTHSLSADGHDAIAFDETQITSKQNRSNPQPGAPSPTLAKGARPPTIAFSSKDHGADAGEISPTLRAGGHDESHPNAGVPPAVVYDMRGNGDGEVSPTLTKQASGDRPSDYAPMIFEPRVARNDRGAPGKVCPPLKARSGEDGRGDAAPHVMENQYADAYEADASSILSTLREQVGEEAVAQWISRILDSLQSKEILRAWLHGESIRGQAEAFGSWVDDRPLPRQEGPAATTLRKVWEQGPDGCTPQGRGLAKQLAWEFGEGLPKLSYEIASSIKAMPDMRRRSQGARILRQALSKIQEVRRSEDLQAQPTYALTVRRLVPAECEALQEFPRNWTRIPWRGKPVDQCPDGPRYKAIGNSWAACCARWIGKRIDLVRMADALG